MPSQISNYQCPACTGPLRFDGASGRLVCDYCGKTYTTEEIEALYAGKDEQAAAAFQKEEEAAAQAEAQQVVDESPSENPWDASEIQSDWGKDGQGMRAYSCPSCGAELFCDDTTGATRCPYCNNPSIIPGQFAGTLKPDYIIPFRLDQKAAEDALRKLYRGKPLLPRAFSKENHIREIRGIYVPFWLFDGVAEGSVSFHATRTNVHRQGDTEITDTDHFDVEREARLEFSKVPADGATKMPDSHMDAIEPFDYKDLKEFSTAYLPGYLANKYDVTAKQDLPRVERRVKETLLQQIEQSVTGYSTCTMKRKNLRIRQGKVSYALLPVWMLNTHWNNKDYLFAMNGQTGKMVGDLPVSKARFAGMFAGILAVISLAGTLLSLVL